MIYIKDMEMPVDCLACRISCKHESYMVIGRPEDCPLEEAKDGDTISRADAIKTVHKYFVKEIDKTPHEIGEDGDDVYTDMPTVNSLLTCNKELSKALKALPSAEAVQGWIPFTRRPMTEEEQKDYPNCTFMFDCVLPDDGDEILVSNGRFVWMDIFCNDIDGCYLDSGDDIDEDMAWMPLPKPYKGGAE